MIFREWDEPYEPFVPRTTTTADEIPLESPTEMS